MASKIVIATRMELLRLKKKIGLAIKGHKLLKEKRDALVSEFFKLVDDLKNWRKRVEEELAIAYRSLIVAQAVSGHAEIERAVESSIPINDIGMTTKTIMGVKVPVFSWESGVSTSAYSKLSTSVELDNATKRFNEVLNTLVKLAEIEATAKMLADEIKKTKRKVNALERIIIPQIKEQTIYIIMRLEEMERENFSRLKIIKKRMD